MAKKYDRSYAERAAAYAAKQRKAKAADKPTTPKRDMDAEVAPGLSLRELIANTKAATGLKYGEATRQLNQQPRQINNWFGQYQQAIKNAQAQQAGNYAGAVEGVKNLQGGLDQAAAVQWAGQQQAMAADAAQRGATVDPALADVAHNASNVRNALTGSFGAMLLSQGANENKYLGERKVNAGVGRIGALKQNAANRQQLAREKGAFKQTYRDTAISDAASTALKNALTASQLGATAASTAETRQDIRTKKLENDYFARYGQKPGTTLSPLEAYRLTYAKKHGYFPATGPKAKDNGSKEGSDDEYGNTPLQQKTRTSDYRKVLVNVDQIKHKIPGWSAMSREALADRIYNAIAGDYSSVNIDILKGAIQKGIYGHVGPKVKQQLTELGVSF